MQNVICFYCLQLNLTTGTNKLALTKGGYHFHWKRGGGGKVWGNEIKREGLKSITNYAQFPDSKGKIK